MSAKSGDRLYLRGKVWWCRLKNEHDKWISKTTGERDKRKAERYRVAAQAALDAKRESTEAEQLTVKVYAERWIADRETRRVRSWKNEKTRLEKHALPLIGDLLLAQVDPQDIRDMVRALRKTKLAPRTVLHVYNTVHNMFENAVVEQRDTGVTSNPVKVKRGELPRKIDKDPEWRMLATFTTDEVERLISDERIPVERRVMYALKSVAGGLRHGEAAAVRWRNLDTSAKPLARLTIAASYDSDRREIKSTKTEAVRQVPVHPALAKILATWKLSHWERIYGRQPTPDDFIVPARTFNPINKTDAARAMKADLATLGLRVAAGENRSRGGHDLRAWFKTQAIEDGADSTIIRRVTHAPPKDVDGGYNRFSWNARCREVSKLRISAESRGQILPFATPLATVEQKARNRWQKVVTPPGLEPGISA